ncbi:MAG TPA: Stk1 family PASTA domain-containing Ser/Thr kinase [Candidatus Aquicultor sp.]|jgi:serine/threonine-protein kinase
MEQQTFNDRYKVIAKIGAGGMAEVYKAIDTVLDRPVAIKVLHRHFAEDEDFVSRFRREAQAAAGLNHPNIVSIYDWGSQNGTYFIVMELLEGESLKHYINSKGTLEPSEAMEIAKKVLSALNFAHKHDIIHRDIKPHNIILTSEGEVKVTDFGIARAGASTMTQTGTILGTAHYLSPEQARGQDVGITSDIYSAGVVLYEMVTGKVPFDGENPVAIALKHVHEMPVRPRELNPHLPESLQTIIAKAMAKNPDSRYQNAAEMRSDIMRLMEGMPIVALAPDEQETMIMAPPSKTGRIERPAYREPVRRRRRGAAPLLVVLILLIMSAGAAGGWFALKSGFLNMKPVIVMPELRNKTVDEAQRMLRERKLRPKVSEAYSNTLGAGLVINQNPDVGEKVSEGDTVDLTVSKGQETKSVPDVSGDTSAAAATTLVKAGLDVGDSNYEYSDEVGEGTVIRTEPAAGDNVPVATKVNLIISKGQAAVQVPDVYGKPSADAETTLKEAGFQVTLSEEYSDDATKGMVTRTSPASGNEAKKGSNITVYVSKGPQMLTVPDVRGKYEDEAKNALQNAGFTVKVEVIENVSPDNDSKVISQEPSSGEQMKKRDAAVTVFVGQAAQP